jgi:hypothetical protein
MEHLRRFYHRTREAEGARRQGVVAAVRVVLAAVTLLLDVGNLTVRRDFAIATRNAAASQCGESKETN